MQLLWNSRLGVCVGVTSDLQGKVLSSETIPQDLKRASPGAWDFFTNLPSAGQVAFRRAYQTQDDEKDFGRLSFKFKDVPDDSVHFEKFKRKSAGNRKQKASPDVYGMERRRNHKLGW